MTDEEFLRAFQGCTLPRDAWTHRAHVRMAWLMLNREVDFQAALLCIRTGIQRLNRAFGTPPEKYLDTLTIGFAALVASRRAAAPAGDTWPDFADRHPELFDAAQSPIFAHYTRETLFSPEAARGFVPPDLKPLPFPNELAPN